MDNLKKIIDRMSEDTFTNPNVVAQLRANGFTSESDGMTFKEAIVASVISSAVRGDLKASQLLAELGKADNESPLERYVRENCYGKEENGTGVSE